MSGKAFVDTNVLIYAHDVDAGAKHDIAKSVLRDLWQTGLVS
jgi:predicted nucleic acid-binding protein